MVASRAFDSQIRWLVGMKMMKSSEKDDDEVNDGDVGAIVITPTGRKRRQGLQQVNTYDGGLLKEWYAFAREHESLLGRKVESLQQKVIERTRNLDDLRVELDKLQKGLTCQHCICHLLRDLIMPNSNVFVRKNVLEKAVGRSLSPSNGVIDLLSDVEVDIGDRDCSLSSVH